MWWYTPVILAFGKQRQEDCEFKVSLDYKACLKKQTKAKQKSHIIQRKTLHVDKYCTTEFKK
jgi:hypothetical protein